MSVEASKVATESPSAGAFSSAPWLPAGGRTFLGGIPAALATCEQCGNATALLKAERRGAVDDLLDVLFEALSLELPAELGEISGWVCAFRDGNLGNGCESNSLGRPSGHGKYATTSSAGIRSPARTV